MHFSVSHIYFSFFLCIKTYFLLYHTTYIFYKKENPLTRDIIRAAVCFQVGKNTLFTLTTISIQNERHHITMILPNFEKGLYESHAYSCIQLI